MSNRKVSNFERVLTSIAAEAPERVTRTKRVSVEESVWDEGPRAHCRRENDGVFRQYDPLYEG